MFNFRVIVILLNFLIYDYRKVFGSVETFLTSNVTTYKFTEFNAEDHNRICVILQLNSKLIVNYTSHNTSKDIIFDSNSSLSGNCTSVYRELIIGNSDIQLRLIWEREPDPYEHGEIGWSSVGAPANTTSGTYALTRINVSLPSSMLMEGISSNIMVNFSNVDPERFKTRSGDHYVCDAKIIFELYFQNTTAIPGIGSIRVTFEMGNSKMQLFSDVNVTDFTGTGQLCHQDLPSDSGVSIGIGVAVAVLVFAVLAFLAIGRLKEKDQQYQELDAGKWATVRT